MTEIQLRAWQSEAVAKAMRWLVEDPQDSRFLLNVAPGAGKTICACVIAKNLLQQNEVERVVVIAPRREVVRQWSEEFKKVTGRYMSKVTGEGDDIDGAGVDVCATWQAIESLSDAFQILCRNHETLVICDEYHHAAIDAAWGIGANRSFVDAKFRLLLSGTPIRTDRAQTVAQNDEGKEIKVAEGGTYSLTYGRAVDLGYCRPTTFHRHAGTFDVVLPDGEKITVSSDKEGDFPGNFKSIPGLQEALNFYKLACTLQYENDDESIPDINSYQATMLKYGMKKLDEARELLPDAGGLVIARNIQSAEYINKLLKMMGEKPLIVHSNFMDAQEKIARFRNTDARWLVSVAMISEGVDIPRLRVLVYLPNPLTELAFRQSMGRVVRTSGPNDISYAYVVMPNISIFERYALRVEQEMLDNGVQSKIPNLKICPECAAHCEKSAVECEACGHQFTSSKPIFRECPECKIQNLLTAKDCQNCGYKFTSAPAFEITLRDALRDGAIIRGMYVTEDSVKLGEDMADELRRRIKGSGYEALMQVLYKLPPEAFNELAMLINEK